MRYSESKERSAELLRATIAQMGRHDAACNPRTFAVWYEYMAGTNARLNQAIDAAMRVSPRLGDDAMEQLYSDHVSEVDEAAMRRVAEKLGKVLLEMVQGAARTGDKAGLFGEQLNQLTKVLIAAEASQLGPAINAVLAGTADMKDSAADLQRQVIAGRQEIERLHTDLSRARQEVVIDPLTRLLNRKGFDQRLQAMLDQPAMPGQAHCLVMLDIDRFKAVNDSYGHVMGDRVLQAVAEALQSCVSDPAHCVSRYGGEEFAILVPDCTAEFAVALAESTRLRVKALKVRDRRTQQVFLTVTVSAGVAMRRSMEDGESLISRADSALYAAKRDGRDRVSCG
jgi:diguanylate cyclase